MNIAILTPLFPPDTAPSARYTKELAARLRGNKVSILLYGHLPESIPNVTFTCIDKRYSIIKRTFSCIKKFLRSARQAELVIIQNGPSVELASLLGSWFTDVPIVMIESDKSALKRTLKHWLLRYIHRRLQKKAIATISPSTHPWPLERPQIHPLKPIPLAEIHSYEASWEEHLQALQKVFSTLYV